MTQREINLQFDQMGFMLHWMVHTKKKHSLWVLKLNTKRNLSAVAPSNFASCCWVNSRFSTVKLDQQLLTCQYRYQHIAMHSSLYRAELSSDSRDKSGRPLSSASQKRRGWLSLQTTCCLFELTWRLPLTDDEDEAVWLEGSQKARDDSRRKERLFEAADLDRAFIQQHLPVTAVCVEPDSIDW